MITTGLMREQDVDAVCEIEREAFSDPWSRKALLREARENPMARYMLVYEDDLPVAYAGAWLVIGEAQITKVAVRADRRGRGYGEAAMRALIQLCADSGMTEITLEVRAGNLPAQGLYHKLGFQDVGRRKNYYENKEDAILMTLSDLPEGHPENDPFLIYED